MTARIIKPAIYSISFNSLQAGRGVQSCTRNCFYGNSLRFQFPSSGKGRSKGAKERRKEVRNEKLFQFPSSGKGRSKNDCHARKHPGDGRVGFNSLQAGRGVQSKKGKIMKKFFARFQFPSSGKGRSKASIERYATINAYLVSIPFKREGAFKGKLLRAGGMVHECVSIPFKREGAFKEI